MKTNGEIRKKSNGYHQHHEKPGYAPINEKSKHKVGGKKGGDLVGT